MVKRREPRKEIRVPVRIFGTDANRKVFSENVFSINVSRSGVQVCEVRSQLKAGEIIGVTYKQNKGRFLIKWVGQLGTMRENQLGLEALPADRPIWDFPLPMPEADEFKRNTKQGERRKYPRLKCGNSVELLPIGEGSKTWGNATEMGMGGCFIEMPIPLKPGTKVKIGIWINQEKLWATAKVVNSRAGFGVGMEFTEMSEPDKVKLQQFLKSITQIRV